MQAISSKKELHVYILNSQGFDQLQSYKDEQI